MTDITDRLRSRPEATFLDETAAREIEHLRRLTAAAPVMLAALKQVEAEMCAGFGSSFGETREQVRRAIRAATDETRK